MIDSNRGSIGPKWYTTRKKTFQMAEIIEEQWGRCDMARSKKLLRMLTDQTGIEGEEGLSERELICLRKLVSIGMRGCTDPELLAAGKKTIAIMNARSLHLHLQFLSNFSDLFFMYLKLT